MKANRGKPAAAWSQTGFTLVEVLVGLIIGTLILGGVMGLISVSLQYTQRVKEKAQVQPVLEAAAQEILTDPTKALEGSLTMGGTADAPTVNVSIAPVEGLNQKPATRTAEQLFRVMLSYRGHLLEFSLLIPRSAFR